MSLVKTLLKDRDDCPDIYHVIDKKIAKKAVNLLDNIRFGTDHKVNMPEVMALIDLKYIYDRKQNCHDCFKDNSTSDIVSTINKLINKIC